MSWSHWSHHIHNKDDLPSIHPRGLFYANWISIYTPLQMRTRWKLRHRKKGLISLPSLCMFDRCIFHHSYTEWDRTLLHIDMTAPFDGWVFKILQLQGSPIKLVPNGLVIDETQGIIITILIIIGSTIDEKPPQTLEYSTEGKNGTLFGILILSHGFKKIHRSSTNLETTQKISQ